MGRTRIVYTTRPVAFEYAAAQDVMYFSTGKGEIHRWDGETATFLPAWGVGGKPHGLALSPDGGTLYVAQQTPSYITRGPAWWDDRIGQEIHVIDTGAGQQHDIEHEVA